MPTKRGRKSSRISRFLVPLTTLALLLTSLLQTTVPVAAADIPVISWVNPTDIIYGTTLSYTQLDATVVGDIPGTFNYDPPIGTLLSSGSHDLSVEFVPIDNIIYTSAYKTVIINVTAKPITVTADSKSKTLGAADPALTYTCSDQAATFSGALSRAPGENIGDYAITIGTLSAGADYSISFVSANLTITPKSVTVTANAQTKVYGAADPALTYTSSDPAATFSGALSRAPGENVGAYSITIGTLSAGADYSISFVSANLTITPKSVTVTANAQTKVYGAADPALTYTSSDPAATFSGALSRAPGENVGPWAINQGTLLGTGNYNISSFVSANLTITAKPITVTADSKSKTLGAADPALTYTCSDQAATFSGALSRAPGENIGDYAITIGTLSAGADYSISFVSANLTITPKSVTVTANAQTKVYGAADPALTYTSSDPAATFSGALSRAPGENVGAYSITIGTLSAGADYSISFVSANLTITPKSVTVTANAQTKVYGAADPALTYTSSDPAATFSGALSRAPGENVGPWAINQGTLLGTGNYNISSFVSANLTITAKPITVTADSKSKTLGAADPALTYTCSDQAATFSGALSRAPGENIGDYAITIGTLSAGADYSISFVSANLTITPKSVTVTANAQTKVYGAADPALTYTSSDPAATFSGALSRAPGENVGAYSITIGTLSAGADYSISFVSANLTITPKSVTVTANAQTKVYGAADPALTYTSSDPAATFSGALSRAPGENVGPWAINQGTLLGTGNYNISSFVSANLTITAKPITVTADSKSKTLGAADPALTYTCSDQAATFSGALSRAPGENIGDYAITIGTLSAGADYSISFVSANLTITPKSVTVTANAQTKVYGAADPALTYTSSDPAATFSGALSRAPGENVGAYSITIGTLSAGADYSISFVSANLTITPKSVTVTANAQTKVYGAADPALTYTSSDPAATFSGALSRAPGENVGPWAINQGTLLGTGNYNISSFVSANLTITAKPITVTADSKSKTLGAADPALTYTCSDQAATFSGALSRAPGENIGDYAITIGTLSAGADYSISFVSANLTITPKSVTVTANAQTKVYGAADPALTYTSSDPAATFSGALSRAPGENVGAYSITIGTLSAGADYSISFVSANLTITPKSVTVTANAQTKVYGAADPALTYTSSDPAATFSGALSRAPGENVGPWAINQGTLLGTGNYNISSFVSANLTITAKPITVTADSKSKTLGAADPALTYTCSDQAATFSGALSRAPGENIGDYAITIGTLSAGADYSISFVSANLTITPKSVTVTANAQTKVYGAADPALTYTSSDPAATFSGALSRAPGENVGAYSITIGTLSAGADYSISFVSANLTITPKSVTVTANAQTKTYGQLDPPFTVSYEGFIAGESATNLNGALVLTRLPGESVNSYAINPSGLTSNNYTISFYPANLIITKATLTVTANDKIINAGDPDPVYTVTYTGLVSPDTGSVITNPSVSVSVVVAHAAAGNYAITVSGGTAVNYNVNYVDGTLIVNSVSGGGGGGGGGGFGSQLVGIGLSGTSPFMDGNGKAITPGQIGTADGTLSLDIPVGSYVWNAAGAAQPFLSASVLAEPPQAPAQNTLVVAYEMGPNGVTFNPAISLTLKYTDSQIPAGTNESDLYISWWDGAKWVKLTSIVDTAANTITAQVSHFTSFALMAPAAPPIPLPTIKINSPSTGATFDTGNITMTVNVGNLNLVAAGRPNTAGEGRIIYYLDVPSIPTTPGVSALSAPGTYQEAGVVSNTWANLSPGNHTLGVQIVQNDLTPFNPPVYATINLVINGPTVVPTTSPPTQIPTNVVPQSVVTRINWIIPFFFLVAAIALGIFLYWRSRRPLAALQYTNRPARVNEHDYHDYQSQVKIQELDSQPSVISLEQTLTISKLRGAAFSQEAAKSREFKKQLLIAVLLTTIAIFLAIISNFVFSLTVPSILCISAVILGFTSIAMIISEPHVLSNERRTIPILLISLAFALFTIDGLLILFKLTDIGLLLSANIIVYFITALIYRSLNPKANREMNIVTAVLFMGFIVNLIIRLSEIIK